MDDPSAKPQRHRRSIRLAGYDYTQPGAYYITLVTQGRVCVFGEIMNGCMVLNTVGQIADREWKRLPERFSGVELDAFQIMPNHIHGVLFLTSPTPELSSDGDRTLSGRNVPPGSIGAIVRAYKSAVALRYNFMHGLDQGRLWQRNYHEHIIRDTKSLDRIRAYIFCNPQQWLEDQEYPGQ